MDFQCIGNECFTTIIVSLLIHNVVRNRTIGHNPVKKHSICISIYLNSPSVIIDAFYVSEADQDNYVSNTTQRGNSRTQFSISLGGHRVCSTKRSFSLCIK